LCVQFAGAAGTLATLPRTGGEVRALLARHLGLNDPGHSWQTDRTLVAEIVNALALLAASCGKVGNEVVNLQRTEIAELAEGAGPGTGGSSTMPQKRNPMLAQNIVALANLMAAKPAAMLQAARHEHERDMAAWTVEWQIVPECFVLSHAALEQTVKLVSSLQVDTARIAENLAMTGGLICSEAVMMDLAADIGRSEAHHVIARVIADAARSGKSFAEALSQDAQIAALRSPQQLTALLDPENYLGDSELTVDRIVRDLK
jgi:3-carboxy-cis,cis-muconate cycloisomerase